MFHFNLTDRKFDSVLVNNIPTSRFLFKDIPLTINQIAKILGVTNSCVYSRIRNGYAVDAKFLRRGRHAKFHTFDGKTMSVKEIANAFGIPTYKVYNTFTKCAKKHLKVSLEMFVK